MHARAHVVGCWVLKPTLVTGADSYEKVKENETVEALHERAKMIVDMELLCENDRL
jgi:hypothetical protein